MAARLQRNIEVCTCQIFFASCKSISFCMKFPVSFMAASRHCFSIFYHHTANHWIGRRMTHSCFCQVQRLLHILFCFCHPDSPFCRHDDGCPNNKARLPQTTWHALFAPPALIVVTVVTYSISSPQTTRHALFASSTLIVVTVVTYSISSPQTTWHALFASSTLIVVTVVTYSISSPQTTWHALFASSTLIVVTVVT